MTSQLYFKYGVKPSSSRSQVFCRVAVQKNVPKLIGKHKTKACNFTEKERDSQKQPLEVFCENRNVLRTLLADYFWLGVFPCDYYENPRNYFL